MSIAHDPWPVRPPQGWPLDPLAPLTRSLYAHWPLWEGAGTGSTAIARDVSAGGGAATGNPFGFNGTVSWGVGPAVGLGGPDGGPTVRIPGAGTAYLQTAGSVFNPATTDFTAEVWFTIDAQTASAQILLVNLSGVGTGRNWLNVAAAGPLTSFLGGAGTTGTTTVTPGVWHQGVVTNQGTTVKVYLDGFLEATATRTIDSNVGVLRVGVSAAGSSVLAGYVGRGGITLWQRALTAAEVLSRCNDPHQIWTPRRRWVGFARPAAGITPGVLMYHRRRRAG